MARKFKKEKSKEEDQILLECERWWVFAFLMFAGGYYGAYTYSCRGGVFCNAQTANFVLFGLAIGSKDWGKALYYLIPMAAYLGGTMLSEFLPKTVKRLSHVRWDTFFVGIEIVIVLILGFIPDSAPVQISQVTVNFMCAMQYNTFRQAEHIPAATTFCTNHVRQGGSYLVKWLKHRANKNFLKRSMFHFGMIAVFILGVIVSAVLCSIIGGKAIWCVEIVLIGIFTDLLHADLTTEKNLLDQIPSGH
ncbi:MAG: DUF1275 domain-containing protein [Clostridiales bacterium]|nr:DUF1275 domain-containing protein [Clostridiales bacterium]